MAEGITAEGTGTTTARIVRVRTRTTIIITTNLNSKRKVLSNLLFHSTRKSSSQRHRLFGRRLLFAGNARSLFFVLLLGLLNGCDHPAVYDLFQPVDQATWAKDETFYFTFEVKDKSVPYDLTLELRNNNFYPYRNIWIISKEEQPVGPLRSDTLECILADEFSKWKGKGFSLFSNSFPVKKNYYFPHEGRYTFSFSHFMTDEALKGIHEIGFRVEKATPSEPFPAGSIEPDKDEKQNSEAPQ